ncbi:SDR family oxidoreductase [Paraferrimonas sedimenticola]|uniref:NAD(P)-dependent oxidoreductase n=1 Tax=Paraferrimonas sedimenticola TaxID=375674 RepID=A0AA37RUJ7_9GAMM|nr:SDR family oxidoreductase [Paraferrimonas sedimenticola]GLP95509.1 NAD(P)-dependent oxidoreductase [Paraferrimonas sedimenticola]
MILLTGATGKTGAVVAKTLAAKGLPLRAIVRDSNKAQFLQELGVELVQGSCDDKARLEQAMKGADKLLILLPNGPQQQAMESLLVEVAKAQQVKYVVKLSSMESRPEVDAQVPQMHLAIEQQIRDSGMDWCFVRPNFFMQNLLASAYTINHDNLFAYPSGKGKVAMTDCDDVGAFLAEVLSDAKHAGQSYEISGPELMDFDRAAEIFSQVLGREIRYVDIPAAEYQAILETVLVPWHATVVTELLVDIASDDYVHTTTTFEEVVGRPPRSLADFVKAHKAVFQGGQQ